MSRELRRVSIVVLAMFAALFLSTSIIQVGQSDTLRSDPRNTRTILASFSAERGDIIVDGQPIASSTPVDDDYQFLRTYENQLGKPDGLVADFNDQLLQTIQSDVARHPWLLAQINQLKAFYARSFEEIKNAGLKLIIDTKKTLEED